MTKAIEIVKRNQIEGGQWQAEAMSTRENWPWMKHSMQIALKVRSTMKAEKITQSALADKLDCSQQYVSLILKGKENLTLETIAKLESALGINIIAPSPIVSGYKPIKTQPQYLCDSGE